MSKTIMTVILLLATVPWLVCHDCKSTGPVAGTELQAAQLWGILLC